MSFLFFHSCSYWVWSLAWHCHATSRHSSQSYRARSIEKMVEKLFWISCSFSFFLLFCLTEEVIKRTSEGPNRCSRHVFKKWDKLKGSFLRTCRRKRKRERRKKKMFNAELGLSWQPPLQDGYFLHRLADGDSGHVDASCAHSFKCLLSLFLSFILAFSYSLPEGA